MRQIRRSVFETNSSSVHTLQISKTGLQPSNLEINKDGNIEVEFGSFDKDYEIYNTQYEKLQYLLSFIGYQECFLEDFYNSYYFQNMRDAVCEYAKAKDIVIVGDKEPYIDHQSADTCVIDLYDKDEIINFVFNEYIALKTDCD